jgi:uncharacterized protein YjiK
LASCAAGPAGPSIRFPYFWPGTPGFGGDIDQYHFKEPSGIVYVPQRGTLFVVDDGGLVGEITKNGRLVFVKEVPGDLEDITLDPSTGLLYIVVEGDDVVLEFDPSSREVTRRFPVNRAWRGNPNFLQKMVTQYDNGLESLAFVPDPAHLEGGTFYAGNQWDPTVIVELEVPLRSSRAPSAEAHIIRVLPVKIDDPAAMYFDPRTRCLNIVSDADNILVEVTLEGRLIAQYAFPGNGQEGLARDDEGYLYIAQDNGGIVKIKDLRR